MYVREHNLPLLIHYVPFDREKQGYKLKGRKTKNCADKRSAVILILRK